MSALWLNVMQGAHFKAAINADSVLLQTTKAWWAKPSLSMQNCVPQASTEDVKEDALQPQGLSPQNISAKADYSYVKPQGLSPQNSSAEADYSYVKPAWILACRALDILLEKHQNGRQAPLSITLASEFVRYLVLPAQPMLSNLVEKTAYAKATFREIYGAIADDWAICLDDVPLHQATLVAAIDRALLAQLQALAQKHHLQLNQVQAYLAAVSKPLKKQVGRNTGSLVLVENNRILWLDLLAGQYQQISSHPIVGDWQTTLQQQLARQAFLQDTPHKNLWVHAPHHQNSALKPILGYTLKRIGIQSKDARYTMLEALA